MLDSALLFDLFQEITAAFQMSEWLDRLLTRLAQFRAHNSHHRKGGAIEST